MGMPEMRNPGSRADRAGASDNIRTIGRGPSIHSDRIIERLQYRLAANALAIDALTPDLDFAMQAAWLLAKGMPLPGDGLHRLNRLALRLIDARHVLEAELPEGVWEAMHPESGRIPPSSGGRGNVGFAEDTARTAGESKRRINEHVSRAEALGDDLEAPMPPEVSQ